ncbi:hypothetical protein KSP39_PZI008778 [Platanthera zijinensis]|uniref:SAC3/GANP/THP3 conserved domain-containing protein n=1 Tax=Platanthera zijinensis TaxID=2320716 RepID=A0AAP0BKU2_9ASPA
MEKNRRAEKLGFQRPQISQTPLSFSSNLSRQADQRAAASVSSTCDMDPKRDSPESLNFSNLVGTCPDMCPAKERAQRERLRDLAVFERLSGHPGKTSSSLAVKKVNF